MTRRALDRLRRWLALPAFIVAFSCSLTPVPEPPTSKPKEPNLSQIDADVHGGIGTTPVTLTGAPGSVEAGVVIWVVNLDAQDAPVETTAAPDGSFQLTLPAGQIGQELRLQARQDGERSKPVDATIVSLSGLMTPSTREPCLVFEPAYELPFGSGEAARSAPLKISSSCAADVTIDSAVLRTPSAPFAATSPLPVTIAPDTSTSITLEYTPGKAGLEEEVLLVRISGAFIERRPITLYGFGGP